MLHFRCAVRYVTNKRRESQIWGTSVSFESLHWLRCCIISYTNLLFKINIICSTESHTKCFLGLPDECLVKLVFLYPF
jgi:hypothetical protein